MSSIDHLLFLCIKSSLISENRLLVAIAVDKIMYPVLQSVLQHFLYQLITDMAIFLASTAYKPANYSLMLVMFHFYTLDWQQIVRVYIGVFIISHIRIKVRI